MAWSNEDTFKFLEMYQHEQDIWDPKSKNYKDRIKVNDAWTRLSEAMGMSIDKLKRRKETLMTAFRFHFKKKQEATRAGTVYNPIWIFYKPMESFLLDVYGTKNFLTEDNDSSSSKQEGAETEEEMEETLNVRKRNKIKKRRLVQVQEASTDMKNAFQTFNHVLKQYNEQHEQQDEDECELYGRLLAKKLRQFSETERQEIMYEFDGVLLNRRLNYEHSAPYPPYPHHTPPEVVMGKHSVSGSSTPSRSPT